MPPAPLVSVPELVAAYDTDAPDPSVPEQRAGFDASGHRGSALNRSFNEARIMAITQATCSYRKGQQITSPLSLGMETQAPI